MQRQHIQTFNRDTMAVVPSVVTPATGWSWGAASDRQ